MGLELDIVVRKILGCNKMHDKKSPSSSGNDSGTAIIITTDNSGSSLWETDDSIDEDGGGSNAVAGAAIDGHVNYGKSNNAPNCRLSLDMTLFNGIDTSDDGDYNDSDCTTMDVTTKKGVALSRCSGARWLLKPKTRPMLIRPAATLATTPMPTLISTIIWPMI
jgi:hypothetical protein